MRSINRQHVYTNFDEFSRTFEKISGCANGGGDAQSAQIIFGSVGIFDRFLNIFDSDESFEMIIFIND